MNKESENVINEFIREEFSIKKVKNSKRKWVRAIIISEGYLRNNIKIYELKNIQNLSPIINDISQILVNVFGCDAIVAKNTVETYLNNLNL